MSTPSLKINEIFYSLQGEGSRIGRPCLFVRLTGCPLRCTYCDTRHAYHEGQEMSLTQIIDAVHRDIKAEKGPNAPFVELTGGEPLEQAHTPRLLQMLLDEAFEVAIETAGSHDIRSVPPSVIKILDRKTPDSGMVKHWLDSNLDYMIPGQDELKFVLGSEADYHWAKSWCEARELFEKHFILFSPVSGQIDPRWLAEQIIQDRLKVRMQVQLHKILWDPEARGV